MMRTSIRRPTGNGANKPRKPDIETINDIDELEVLLQRNLRILGDTSRFASSSKSPSAQDPLATRLEATNDRIRHRIHQLQEQQVSGLTDALGKTTILSTDSKSPDVESGRDMNGGGEDDEDVDQLMELGGESGHDFANSPSKSAPKGKQLLAQMMEDRMAQKSHAANGRRKSVMQVPIDQSLKIQEQDAIMHPRPERDPRILNGGTDGFGGSGAGDELDTITRAARLQAFMSFGTSMFDDDWGGFSEEDDDDDEYNPAFDGPFENNMEEEEEEEEAGAQSEGDGMDLSGIIQVDVAKTEAATPDGGAGVHIPSSE